MIDKQGMSRVVMVVVVVVIGDTILVYRHYKATVSPSLIRHASFICHN